MRARAICSVHVFLSQSLWCQLRSRDEEGLVAGRRGAAGKGRQGRVERNPLPGSPRSLPDRV